MGQEQSSDKQQLVTPTHFNTSHNTSHGLVELLPYNKHSTGMITGGSASLLISGNVGTIDTNMFRITCNNLLSIIKPPSGVLEGFTIPVKNIEEIVKLYDDISNNFSKQNTQILFSLSGKNNNNILLGAKSTVTGYKQAFDVMTENILNHLQQTRKNLEDLVAISEANARRSLKRSNSVTGVMSNSSSNANLSSMGYDWSNIDNKQRYFEIKDECEILTSHHLEEMIGYKKLVSFIHDAELQGLDYSDSSTQSQLNTTNETILDEFGAEFWKNNIGGNVFSVSKDSFLDTLDTFFDFNVRTKKNWVDEISYIIDPTCDDVVSMIDFKTTLKWFGPFSTQFFPILNTFLDMKHFWGSMTSIEAQQLLDGQEPGTYITRFAENEPGSFYVSVVEDGGDTFGYFDSLLMNSNRKTYHYLLRRKRDEREGKMYFILIDSDMDYKHEKIENLFKQYHLTFKSPYLDDRKKEEHSKKKKGEDELDFVSFMISQKSQQKGRALTDDDDEDEDMFTTFRGRIPETNKLKESAVKTLNTPRQTSSTTTTATTTTTTNSASNAIPSSGASTTNTKSSSTTTTNNATKHTASVSGKAITTNTEKPVSTSSTSNANSTDQVSSPVLTLTTPRASNTAEVKTPEKVKTLSISIANSQEITQGIIGSNTVAMSPVVLSKQQMEDPSELLLQPEEKEEKSFNQEENNQE